MRNVIPVLIFVAFFHPWANASVDQSGDLVYQNFDRLVPGSSLNVSANGSISFPSGKWTNDESSAGGTNSTWNKFYSYPVKIAADTSGRNTTNYLSGTGSERMSVLFAPQTSGTVILEARVKTPSVAGSSGFISLDNDPGATSTTATGRSNLVYLTTTAFGNSTLSYSIGSTQIGLTGELLPDSWYYIKVRYYISGLNAGKWDLYYGKNEATTLLTGTPVAYQSASSAYALQRFYVSSPFLLDEIRIYQTPPVEPPIVEQPVLRNLILFEPIRDVASTFSILPTIDANYSATITSTAPAGIIRTDGTVIARPSTTTVVDVTVQVQNKTNAAEVASKTLQVKVTPTYRAPVGDLAAAQASFGRKKVGLFVHYIPFLTAGKVAVISDINDLADSFDAEQFAQDAADFGVEYVVFTAWHARMLPLFPSKVNKKWRDDRRTVAQMQSYSNRDLIGDLISALHAKGIDLHLYIHPTDGHDFLDRGVNDNLLQDQVLTGFADATGSYAYWNQYVNELLNELCERYGDGIKGFWIDGGSTHLNVARLKQTLRSYNPAAIIVENVGGNRSASVSTPGLSGMADHNAWEVNNVNTGSLSFLAANPNIVPTDGKTWPAYLPQVALVIGNGWWAKLGSNSSRYAVKDLFLYNILLASLNKSGGLLYSTGCYAGKASDYAKGNLWDGIGNDGTIYATLKAVNDLMKPIEASIKNTLVGKAYPSNTTACSWLDQYQWGVSTESPDGRYVYLHVVKPPVGKTLSIGAPADQSTFSMDAILLKSNQKVGFVKTATGYDITLPEVEAWDSLNTVIRLERSTSPISQCVTENSSVVRTNGDGLSITCASVQQLEVYGTDGTRICSCRLNAGENTVFVNRKGLLLIRLQGDGKWVSTKVLIE